MVTSYTELVEGGKRCSRKTLFGSTSRVAKTQLFPSCPVDLLSCCTLDSLVTKRVEVSPGSKQFCGTCWMSYN